MISLCTHAVFPWERNRPNQVTLCIVQDGWVSLPLFCSSPWLQQVQGTDASAAPQGSITLIDPEGTGPFAGVRGRREGGGNL